MIKKITTAGILFSTLLYGQIDQSGFFVGLDYSKGESKVDYSNNGFGTSFTVDAYRSKENKNNISYKLGYQYYYTRLYARLGDYKYTDQQKSKYTIESRTYELNTEYIPVFYMSKDSQWDIRGVFGIGVGYNQSKFSSYDQSLLPAGLTLPGDSQSYMEYGYQLGILFETEIGVSAECGFRFRKGNLLEFTDGQNNSTLDLKSSEYYFGLNYLF